MPDGAVRRPRHGPGAQANWQKRGIEPALAARAADLADGSLASRCEWIEDDVIGPAAELAGISGRPLRRPAAGRPARLVQEGGRGVCRAADEARRAGEQGPGDARGLNLYLRLAAEHVRRRMTASAGLADEGANLDHACSIIDAVARSEAYLDANVNIALVFQQLAATLSRP